MKVNLVTHAAHPLQTEHNTLNVDRRIVKCC